MAPRYRLTTDAFIEPQLIKQGSVIEYNGVPGPHMEAVNDEAKAVLEKYYKDNPGVSLNPVESLPMTVAKVVAAPNPQPAGVPFGTLADPGKPVRIEDLVIRHAGTAGGAIATPDAEGYGSKAPTSEKPLDQKTPSGGFTQTTGDASDPGKSDGDADQKKAADKANEGVAQAAAGSDKKDK